MSKRMQETFTGKIVVDSLPNESWVRFTDERGYKHAVYLRGDWARGLKARVTVEQIPAPKRRKP